MPSSQLQLITPDWPAPKNVKALSTTRHGGVSHGAYASLNLGSHVGDAPEAVEHNRAILGQQLPMEPLWLTQVHGTAVVNAACTCPYAEADAAVARHTYKLCTVMTADCLPVLFCDRAGTVVAAAHAGWRGLANGVLEATVKAMNVEGKDLLVWFGPAIGPAHFEVGQDVFEAFTQQDAAAAAAFTRGATPGKWLADLYSLARLRLGKLGVTAFYGGERCTYREAQDFFSYRRDGQTGRMATMIWLD